MRMCLSCRAEAINPVSHLYALQDKRVHSLVQYAMNVSSLLQDCLDPFLTFLHSPGPLVPSSSFSFQVEKSLFEVYSSRKNYYNGIEKIIDRYRKQRDGARKGKKGMFLNSELLLTINIANPVFRPL